MVSILAGGIFCSVLLGWSEPVKPAIYYSKAWKGLGNKTYTFRFSLWDAETEGSEAWQEEKVVQAKSSVIGTYLGEVSSIEEVNFSRALWVQVEEKLRDGTYVLIGEREELPGVPYAMWAMSASGPKGDPGPVGPQGPAGPQGPQGVTGQTGT